MAYLGKEKLDELWIRLCQLILQVARACLCRSKLSNPACEDFPLLGPGRISW